MMWFAEDRQSYQRQSVTHLGDLKKFLTHTLAGTKPRSIPLTCHHQARSLQNSAWKGLGLPVRMLAAHSHNDSLDIADIDPGAVVPFVGRPCLLDSRPCWRTHNQGRGQHAHTPQVRGNREVCDSFVKATML